MHKLTLYGKEDCSLCEEMKAIVKSVQAQHSFQLEEIDVGLDPKLEAVYGTRIPLIKINDRLAFKYRVDPEELLVRLLGESGSDRHPGAAGGGHG